MNKNIIISSIKKVFLDLKDVEPFIFWDSENYCLNLKSLDVAYNTTVMSTVSFSGFTEYNNSLVLKEPDSVLKCLDIADENIDIEFKKAEYSNSFFIKDSNFESEIIVADINYIPQHILEKKNTEPEEPISYDVTINVNSGFIDKFIKAKKANKSETVSIWTKDRISTFQLGDINNFSNKIKFSVEMEGIFDMKPLHFSSQILQIILERNKKGTGTIQVDPDGLMKLYFEESIGDIVLKSTYFLVSQDNL